MLAIKLFKSFKALMYILFYEFNYRFAFYSYFKQHAKLFVI